MASSSSNPSSTSSSSSTTSTPSAARVLSDNKRVRPRLPTRAAAPAASAALGVVPGASASATPPGVATGAIASATAPGVPPSATASASAPNVAPDAIASTSAPGVSRSIKRPPTTYIPTAWGVSKGVPPPTYFAHAHQRGRGDRARNSVVVSQHVSRKPSQKSGWQNAADPTSTFAPSRLSTEGSSPSTSAWSKPLPWLSTVASAPTDTRPASATSSSTTPLPDITLVPNASGSAPAVATSAHAAPEQDAFTSSTSSAPGVTTSVDLALEPDATTSTTPSAPGVATIVDAALEPDTSASTPSSAPGVTTIADPSATTSAPGAAPTASATTSAPGAAPTIPSLRDNWVAVHWGIVPGPQSVERCSGQQAFGGNGMPPVEALYPDPLCPWRAQVPPRSFGVRLCWECRLRPAQFEARPCGHLAICVRCYCYSNSNMFVCPYCGSPITWLL